MPPMFSKISCSFNWTWSLWFIGPWWHSIVINLDIEQEISPKLQSTEERDADTEVILAQILQPSCHGDEGADLGEGESWERHANPDRKEFHVTSCLAGLSETVSCDQRNLVNTNTCVLSSCWVSLYLLTQRISRSFSVSLADCRVVLWSLCFVASCIHTNVTQALI